MFALRIVLIVVAVVALDIAVLFFGVGDPDEGWGKVWRAVDAQYDHPSAENQRALAAAEKEYEARRRPRLNLVGVSLLVITGGGLFIIVREFRRSRNVATSKAPPITAPNI